MHRPSLPLFSGLSRRTALGRVAAAGAALGLGTRVGRAAAQDATAAHPLVGAWRFANDPNDPANVALGAFHPDGTFVEVLGDIGSGIGAWRATGDRTAEATSIKLDTDPDRNHSVPGTVTDYWSLEVDASGTTLTAAKTFAMRHPAETVGLQGSYTATATRIEVEAAPPLGTPITATPTS
jgi:hypothetical protein